MSGVVDCGKVEGDEGRAFLLRQIEPGQHLVHALPVGLHVLVREPVGRLHSVNRRFGSRPEHRCGDPTMTLRVGPDRFAQPPPWVADRRAVRQAEESRDRRIRHLIPHDPVPVRPQSRHQGVVIGKGLGRYDRSETRRPHAVAGEGLQRGRRIPIEVIPAHPVDGDQDDDRRRFGTP
jgi:hypothetical protein